MRSRVDIGWCGSTETDWTKNFFLKSTRVPEAVQPTEMLQNEKNRLLGINLYNLRGSIIRI